MSGDVNAAARNDRAMGLIRRELERAQSRFGPYHSPHEAIAVIREEYLELEREVFGNMGLSPNAQVEAVQIAAVAARYLVDLFGGGA